MTARRRAAIALAVGCLAGGAAGQAAGQTIAPQGTQPGGLASGTAPADVASKCNSCHAGGTDDDGKAFRPWDTWGGTMMANAVRDPLFLAALTVSEQDAPGSGAFCLRCHTPKGFVKGHATGVGAALDADDQQGVDCEACHRSIDASAVQPAVMHDGATIAALAVAGSAGALHRQRAAALGPARRPPRPVRRRGQPGARGRRISVHLQLRAVRPVPRGAEPAAHPAGRGRDRHRVSVSARQHVHRVAVVRLRARRHREVVHRLPHAGGARRRAEGLHLSVGDAARESAHARVRRRQRLGPRGRQAGGARRSRRTGAGRSTSPRPPCRRCSQARCRSTSRPGRRTRAGPPWTWSCA